MIQGSGIEKSPPMPSAPERASLDVSAQIDPVIEVGSSFGEANAVREPSHLDADAIPEGLENFDLGASLRAIPDKLFFRIGDVGDLLGLKTYVLRFWETEFPMIKPTKSKTGQRVYRRQDVELLMLIKHLLYVERYSIEGAVKRIREIKRGGEMAQVKATGSTARKATNAGLSAAAREELRTRVLELRLLVSKPLSDIFRY